VYISRPKAEEQNNPAGVMRKSKNATDSTDFTDQNIYYNL
jgi:hypothetical protein